MADIGSTLRETRIRDKIDITVVEQATKIRAKYLRALENEEWGVLPGPTFVKSFLRTYAEFLGLDAHMLVEEYRARYEQPDDLELPAFAHSEPLRSRVRPPGPPSRAVAITALVVGFLALLLVLGLTGNKDSGQGGASKTAAQGTRPRAADRSRQQRQTPGAAATVGLSVVPARPVWVCLVDANGKALVGGRTLAAGERQGPFRSKRFLVTLGNGGGDLLVNGNLKNVPNSSQPIGYAVTPSGTRTLSAGKRPTCAPGQPGSGSGGGTGTTGTASR
jgi:cytoskeletal protein RodZ